MTTPPLLPQSEPSPQSPKRNKVSTIIYSFLFVLLFLGNFLLAYQSSLSRFPANRSTVIGACLGGVVLYLAVVAGIACIWKGNRNFHGLIKVLFWFSLLMLIVKLNAARKRPNALEPTATPLVGATVAKVRTRPVRPTVPVGGCGSAWVR